MIPFYKGQYNTYIKLPTDESGIYILKDSSGNNAIYHASEQVTSKIVDVEYVDNKLILHKFNAPDIEFAIDSSVRYYFESAEGGFNVTEHLAGQESTSYIQIQADSAKSAEKLDHSLTLIIGDTGYIFDGEEDISFTIDAESIGAVSIDASGNHYHQIAQIRDLQENIDAIKKAIEKNTKEIGKLLNRESEYSLDLSTFKEEFTQGNVPDGIYFIGNPARFSMASSDGTARISGLELSQGSYEIIKTGEIESSGSFQIDADGVFNIEFNESSHDVSTSRTLGGTFQVLGNIASVPSCTWNPNEGIAMVNVGNQYVVNGIKLTSADQFKIYYRESWIPRWENASVGETGIYDIIFDMGSNSILCQKSTMSEYRVQVEGKLAKAIAEYPHLSIYTADGGSQTFEVVDGILEEQVQEDITVDMKTESIRI